MDHKVSKDMISSGMIPSGEKTQADLSRTQYGSAPSPSKLMDAYKSMYEHHKKDADGNTIPHEGEELNEGKIPAGLQAYLDKKKGKKEDKKDMKEDVDLFDVVSGVFVAEGYEEKDAYKVMSQLTEEQLNEIAISGTIATLGAGLLKGLLGAGKVATAAGKGVLSAGKTLASKGMGAAKTAFSGAKNVAQTGMSKATKAFGKVTNIAKPQQGPKLPPTQGPRQANLGDKFKQNVGDKMADLGKFVGDEVKGEVKRKIVQGDSGNKVTPIRSGGRSTGVPVAASADLFDIVKGQLLDEGMSEEEIKDIMLTLTPDEILNEISVGKMANYISAADKDIQKTADSMKKNSSVMGDDPRVKKMTDRAKGMAMAGEKIAKKMNPSLPIPRTEEYKNFDPKNPDPKQVKKQAEQEKNRQKFNDPRGVKNTNIGGQGLDPMDK